VDILGFVPPTKHLLKSLYAMKENTIIFLKGEINMDEKERGGGITPPMNPDDRLRVLINKSYDRVEQRIDSGEATAQELVYFLKLGSIREQKEMMVLEADLELRKAKAEALASAKRSEDLYNQALEAMKSYSGHGDNYDDPNLY